jgi:hypothetical protein
VGGVIGGAAGVLVAVGTSEVEGPSAVNAFGGGVTEVSSSGGGGGSGAFCPLHTT